uniref:Carboxylic ester hydrolase n=1 Tax=Leptobrachium leishanense TaxID=445787 RepID=A0A8C5N3Q3_9ANUR
MGFLIQTFALCCLSLIAIVAGHQEKQPTVTTKYGKLRGKTSKVLTTDRQVDVFMGIPFAKPPVGELRFAAPEAPVPWGSDRDATKEGPVCLQSNFFMESIKAILKADVAFPPLSEDCLYLNVFTPQDRQSHSKLPVMVFIHGGALSVGGANMFYGAALSALENVVVVVIQYRLGILGFMSDGTKEAPGNYGFFDQVAALYWVQENIKDFGGDPHSVTIFGESAGGVSVSALVLSPLAKGLFHRAIAESGTAVIPGLMISSQEEITASVNFVAERSGCDPASLIACLKQKTEQEIIAISSGMGLLTVPGSVDGVFLPKPAEEILANKEANDVPLLIGINEREFGFLLPLALNVTAILRGMDKATVEALIRALPFLEIPESDIASTMEEYFGDTNDPEEIRNRFLDLGGDNMFVMPALKTAKYHRDSGYPVYFYEFRHRLSMYKDSKPAFVTADHGDELFCIVGGMFLSENIMFKATATKEEEVLCKTMMKYWANFARTGDPNGKGLVNWPRYTKNEEYMVLDLNMKSSEKYKEDKFVFWNKGFPDKSQKKIPEEDRIEL